MTAALAHDHDHAKLTFDDVHVYANRNGQPVVTVPDAIAQRLFAEIETGSGVFTAHTWGYCASTTLIALYAATPVPDGLAGHWRALADMDRDGLVGGRRVQAFIAAASAYDPDARGWVPGAGAGLRTWAFPERSDALAAVVWREWND